MKTRSGFTLIELLIVVAIIGILAAIAVPNFLNAQVRAKVALVQSEHKSITTALESFYVDNSGYPPCNNDRLLLRKQYRGLDCKDCSIDMAHIMIGSGSRARRLYLTTPIAYMSTIPFDPFRGDGSSEGYGYGSDGQSYYVLTSYGPDTADGLASDEEFIECEYTGAKNADYRYAGYRDGSFFLNEYRYDASNGIVSDGDIIRIGP